MKTAAIIFGALLFLIGMYNLFQYLTDYDVLTAYGKGYVWGNGILLVMGFFMAYLGLKKTHFG